MEHRPLSEVLKDADNAQTNDRLYELHAELEANHKSYTRAELDFAVEHLTKIQNEKFIK